MVAWEHQFLSVMTSITTKESLAPEGSYLQSGKRIKRSALAEVPFVHLHGGSVQWQVVAQWWVGRQPSLRESLKAGTCLECYINLPLLFFSSFMLFLMRPQPWCVLGPSDASGVHVSIWSLQWSVSAKHINKTKTTTAFLDMAAHQEMQQQNHHSRY